MTFLIVLGLVVAAGWPRLPYDRKHRAMGGSGGGYGRETRLDGQEKASRWGAGGGG